MKSAQEQLVYVTTQETCFVESPVEYHADGERHSK
jgi:hypothetical protein